MKINRKTLLAGASFAMLGLGIASPAQAFDDVEWSWNNDVTSVTNMTVNVDDAFDWSGLVEVETIQTNIGDVVASSTVTGIDNTPPNSGTGSGVVSIDETFVFQTFYDDSQDPDAILATGMLPGTPDGLNGEVVSGSVNEGDDVIADLTFHVTGEYEFEDVESASLDGADLPEIASAATSVANNHSIDSTSAVNLHNAQFNFGGFNPEASANSEDLDLLGVADATDNAHTDAALGLTLAAALGIITPGTVSATSTVDGITNASVDSSATAVANNMSVSLEPLQSGDAFLVADLTQFNYADVSATSSITDVSVSNYSNLDVIDGPLVNSVATAVGNNVSISVGNFDVGE